VCHAVKKASAAKKMDAVSNENASAGVELPTTIQPTGTINAHTSIPKYTCEGQERLSGVLTLDTPDLPTGKSAADTV